MESKTAEELKKEQREAIQPGTAATQSRALEAVREAGSALAGANLLEATGPLAELTAAEARGVLDEARRVLIAKKGRGVVFEAMTVVNAQVASERYSLNLTAKLASTMNSPRADVLIVHAGLDIELQLKVGTDKYIRSALRRQADGVTLLVPVDATQGAAVGSLEFDGIEIEAPTTDQLQARTEGLLDRLSTGEPIVTFADAAKRALKDSLIDALVIAVLDLASQMLEKPDEPVDWKRTGKAVLRATATTVTASLLATANTATAMRATGRAIEVVSIARGTRAAAVLVPHAIDVCVDMARASSGEISSAQFARRASGHVGAAAAEYLMFPILARIAARLGPIGGAIAMVAGGLFFALVGRKAGEFLHDVAVTYFAELPASQQVVEGKVVRIVEGIEEDAKRETVRRAQKAAKSQCEEPRCSRPHHARGMCKRHYNRWYRRQKRINWRIYSCALSGNR